MDIEKETLTYLENLYKESGNELLLVAIEDVKKEIPNRIGNKCGRCHKMVSLQKPYCYVCGQKLMSDEEISRLFGE